jgi:hypothetical protein
MALGYHRTQAVTHYLHLNDEIQHALPIETFSSIPLSQMALFAEPGKLTRDSFPDEAVAVHLWGKELRRHVTDKFCGRFPDRSFLAQVLHEDAKFNSITD